MTEAYISFILTSKQSACRHGDRKRWLNLILNWKILLLFSGTNKWNKDLRIHLTVWFIKKNWRKKKKKELDSKLFVYPHQ